jgi:hypothetical protein
MRELVRLAVCEYREDDVHQLVRDVTHRDPVRRAGGAAAPIDNAGVLSFDCCAEHRDWFASRARIHAWVVGSLAGPWRDPRTAPERAPAGRSPSMPPARLRPLAPRS